MLLPAGRPPASGRTAICSSLRVSHTQTSPLLFLSLFSLPPHFLSLYTPSPRMRTFVVLVLLLSHLLSDLLIPLVWGWGDRMGGDEVGE